MQSQMICLDLRSDWHIGSGEEGGAYADALALKDRSGLPYVPGKSLKGLFREAFEQANDNGWFSNFELSGTEIINVLFGQQGETLTTQGILHFSSAVLSQAEQDFFTLNSDPSVTKHLYRVLQSTAINTQTGVAQNTSLRSIEVAVPMILLAEVSVSLHLTDNQTVKEWPIAQWLTQCSRLILSLGAKRHRGLGQVMVTVTEGVAA
ncbi:TPA: RAMP superfamily CRISPR-associated protein [Photobacterium damselae]